MKKELIDIIDCPYDHFYPLEIVVFLEDESKVKEGLLYCKNCNRCYPVREFIICMMPDKLRKIDERKILKDYKDKIPKQIFACDDERRKPKN